MFNSMGDFATMFASSFIVVFLMGLQSRNVHASRYVAAVMTSFGISVSQFIFVKYAVNGSYAVFFTCAAGGCLGIAFSIWFYTQFMERKHHGQPA